MLSEHWFTNKTQGKHFNVTPLTHIQISENEMFVSQKQIIGEDKASG